MEKFLALWPRATRGSASKDSQSGRSMLMDMYIISCYSAHSVRRRQVKKYADRYVHEQDNCS